MVSSPEKDEPYNIPGVGCYRDENNHSGNRVPDAGAWHTVAQLEAGKSKAVLPLMKSLGEKGREGAFPAMPGDREREDTPAGVLRGNCEAEPPDDRYAN